MRTFARFERLELQFYCPYASSSKNRPVLRANVIGLDTLNANFVGSYNRAVELVEQFN
jgi:hypothetical protein